MFDLWVMSGSGTALAKRNHLSPFYLLTQLDAVKKAPSLKVETTELPAVVQILSARLHVAEVMATVKLVLLRQGNTLKHFINNIFAWKGS